MGLGGSIARVSVRNRQRKISVDTVALEEFAAKAVRCCLRLPQRKRTNLKRLHEIFLWLISDRRMARLHWRFLGQRGPTDVLTFQHGEIFTSSRQPSGSAGTLESHLCRDLSPNFFIGL